MRIVSAACVTAGIFVAALVPAQNLPQTTPPPFALLSCTRLPIPRQMHGAAVVGARLYVIGGILNVGGWTPSVISAPIIQGGALGSWREERPMPEIRSYISQSIEVVNDRIYVIGGAVAATSNTLEADLSRANDVLWTRVNADGSLQEWRRSQPFDATPVSCIATSSNDKHLFVLGGSAQEGILDQTWVCDLSSDGSPTNWRKSSPLPSPLWFHGAAILEDRLFVWGGLTERSKDAINPKVYSALVNDDGTLGVWREETPMPAPTYSSAFCGFNDYLVGVAGRYKGAIFTNAIWYARVQDGKVGPWNVLNTNLETRVYHALGLDKLHGYVYIMGGQYKDANTQGFGRMLGTVQAFQITQPKQSRLELKSASSVSPSTAAPAATSAAAPNAKDFMTLAAAQVAAKTQRKPILVLFYSPEVPACKRFWDDVVSKPAFSTLTRNYVVSVYDITKEPSDVPARYGIFKVPAAAVLENDGTLVRNTIRLKSEEDLKLLLNQ
ncbi:MAG: thioredoxin family protein [Candidatus Sumerlaeaceae bacterium]|nr:thioredoxin family protein [Candidatus Sumerlaeaceae bacterium]